MDALTIKAILEEVAHGTRSASEAFGILRDLPYADLGIAKLDAHRVFRNGFSETILCEGKEQSHLVKIIEDRVAKNINVLGTRVSKGAGELIVGRFPNVNYDPLSRSFFIVPRQIEPLPGKLAIICAGTSDIPVAEEARRTAVFMGIEALTYYDVGVAGLHRLMSCADSLRSSDVIIVVAGMEGALPSVIGGLVGIPIIAVPTSVGYGVSFNGIAALLAMLNCCSEGISVVNIDNGFGAACAALRILRTQNAKR